MHCHQAYNYVQCIVTLSPFNICEAMHSGILSPYSYEAIQSHYSIYQRVNTHINLSPCSCEAVYTYSDTPSNLL